MTDRDEFAKAAMTALAQGFMNIYSDNEQEWDAHVAKRFWELADAMLAAREPKGAAEKSEFANGWIEWNGGECPVAGGALVEYRTALESVGKAFAKDLRWTWAYCGNGGDIIAYRVVQEGGEK